MSTGIQTLNGSDAFVGTGSKPAGFFQRTLQHIIEGQERKAAAMVRQYLAGLSDERLAELGYGPIAIKALRKRATTYGVAWM